MIPGAADRHWREPEWPAIDDEYEFDDFDGFREDVGRGDLGGETDVSRVVAPSAPRASSSAHPSRGALEPSDEVQPAPHDRPGC